MQPRIDYLQVINAFKVFGVARDQCQTVVNAMAAICASAVSIGLPTNFHYARTIT